MLFEMCYLTHCAIVGVCAKRWTSRWGWASVVFDVRNNFWCMPWERALASLHIHHSIGTHLSTPSESDHPEYTTPQLLVGACLPYSLYYYLYLFVFSTVLLLSLLFINAWKLGNFTVITVSWFLFILSVSGGPVRQQELVICHPMHIDNVVVSIQVWVRSHWKALWSKESRASQY